MAVVVMGRTGAGTKPTFADVFAAHHGEALRLAYLLCGDPHRAEDAVAEAFTKMYRRWRRGGIEVPRAYVRRAVVNEVNSRFRRLALERREARRRHGDDRGARGADEDLADRDEVFRVLARLPARQRTAVVLRYYADLSEADTAAAMDVTVGTVKSCVSRGLSRLRELLEEHEPTGGPAGPEEVS
ncbi:MAG TPA: SigE family RNA polymerase sigma factor [Egibacteraceae bacterium]|nr:SigE family RNA polymerase sigma factor [Egibacteraceae bacterium]